MIFLRSDLVAPAGVAWQDYTVTPVGVAWRAWHVEYALADPFRALHSMPTWHTLSRQCMWRDSMLLSRHADWCNQIDVDAATDTTMQCLFLKGKLKTKQNPTLKGGGYWVYILRKVLGLLVEAKGASTTWANMVHGPTAQKTAAQHPDRFWTSYCFGDSRQLRMNLGLKLVPLEAP